MRITRLEVSGFRGFAGPQALDLDADAVVIVGANGQGKTSLFDGILWGLTGRIPRLGDDARLVSMYSSSGEARVELGLRDSTGSSLSIVRNTDGGHQQLRVEHQAAVVRGESARERLLELLWPDAVHTPDSLAALTAALTRSVYLEELVGSSDVGSEEGASGASEVSELASAVEDSEGLRVAADTRLREAETFVREHARWRSERGRRLRDLEIEAAEETDFVPLLDKVAKDSHGLSSALDDHQARGERLALELTRASERARRSELEMEVKAARAEDSNLDELVRSRERTGELAGSILDGLRDAASQVVTAQLDRIEPVLQRIYATADPHPSFRAVRLLASVARGRGRLNAAIDDSLAELSTRRPRPCCRARR